MYVNRKITQKKSFLSAFWHFYLTYNRKSFLDFTVNSCSKLFLHLYLSWHWFILRNSHERWNFQFHQLQTQSGSSEKAMKLIRTVLYRAAALSCVFPSTILKYSGSPTCRRSRSSHRYYSIRLLLNMSHVVRCDQRSSRTDQEDHAKILR